MLNDTDTHCMCGCGKVYPKSACVRIPHENPEIEEYIYILHFMRVWGFMPRAAKFFVRVIS